MKLLQSLRCTAFAISLVSLPAFLITGAAAAAPTPYTREDAISGKMTIDFATRRKLDRSNGYLAGSAEKGVVDTYTLNINVAETTEYTGKIKRLPRLRKAVDGTIVQAANLQYFVDMWLRNPSDLQQRKQIGRIVGTVPIDANEVYKFTTPSAADRAPLRTTIDAVGSIAASENDFSGRMIGKAGDAAKYRKMKFTRKIAGRTITIEASKIDPLTFDNLVLAAGPTPTYPSTTVNGKFDFDYDSSNYFIEGMTMSYRLGGVEYTDKVSGTIRWVEAPDRATSGVGYYEFNVRYNEDDNKPAVGESGAFSGDGSAPVGDEDAFFNIDTSIPSITGRVEYVDIIPKEGEAPTSSQVDYHLNANKVTKQQLINFFKLWLMAVGPINDE